MARRMPLDCNLPASRSLLDRPQRLGVLPTMWFWNDRTRQGLLMPLFVASGVPLAAVLAYLTARLHLSGWLPSAFALLYPFLLMGLVERRMRRELRLRPPEQRLLAAATSAPPRPLSRALPATLAVLCTTMAIMVTLGASGALILLVFALLAGGAITTAILPRTRRALARLASADSDERVGLPPGPADP
jgi:hypothetical protein